MCDALGTLCLFTSQERVQGDKIAEKRGLVWFGFAQLTSRKELQFVCVSPVLHGNLEIEKSAGAISGRLPERLCR